MDFCVPDSEEIVVTKQDQSVIKNIFVNFDEVNKYMKTEQYNDPIIGKIMGDTPVKLNVIVDGKPVFEEPKRR